MAGRGLTLFFGFQYPHLISPHGRAMRNEVFEYGMDDMLLGFGLNDLGLVDEVAGGGGGTDGAILARIGLAHQ